MASVSIDRVRISGCTLEELITHGFLDKLRKALDTDIILVAALIITEKGDALMMAHDEPEDYEEKVVKITLPPENSEKYIEAIKKAVKLTEQELSSRNEGEAP